MLQVRGTERDPVAGRAKCLRALQHPLAFFTLAGARQRQAEAVGCGHVVRLVSDRRTQHGNGLSILAILQVNLTEIDAGPGVVGIDLAHALEKARGVFVAVFGAGDEAKHVRRLKGGWQQPRGVASFARGAFEIPRIQQGEAQIQVGKAERSIDA